MLTLRVDCLVCLALGLLAKGRMVGIIHGAGTDRCRAHLVCVLLGTYATGSGQCSM